MVDLPTRGPLFPPRADDEGIPPPPVQPAPPKPPPPPPEQSVAFNVDMAKQIDQAVSEVFLRRYGPASMPFQQARELTYLERELIGALIERLARKQ